MEILHENYQMNNILTLHDNTLHIWRIEFSDFSDEVSSLRSILSTEELARADRFRFVIHRERFIIAHGFLRKTLGLYLGLEPQNITFFYGEHGKPSLTSTSLPFPSHPQRRGDDKGKDDNDKGILNLHFNISHSEELALFACMLHQEIGIDIEKITTDFKEEIAKRFFSNEEYKNLMQLPEKKRAAMFYEYWSRKEAILKAVGTGLFQEDTKKNQIYVETIFIHPDYKAAFATFSPPKSIKHFIWKPKGFTANESPSVSN